MKVNSIQEPKSSFLSVQKDMNLIINKLFSNKRLQKLLYYTTKDCLNRKDLTTEQVFELFDKNIKILPKLKVDSELLNYIVVVFDNFSKNFTNPEFRDNTIEFDIVCHFDQWNLTDFKLRPFLIAAELDSMLDKKRLTGIGKVEFIGCKKFVLNDEYAGLCLMYQVIHGEEDKKKMLNPADEKQFIEDFFEQFEE